MNELIGYCKVLIRNPLHLRTFTSIDSLYIVANVTILPTGDLQNKLLMLNTDVHCSSVHPYILQVDIIIPNSMQDIYTTIV